MCLQTPIDFYHCTATITPAQPSGGRRTVGVQPTPPHLGCSEGDMAVLCPACYLPTSHSSLPAPSLQFHGDIYSQVCPQCHQDSRTASVLPDNPSRIKGQHKLLLFVTQQTHYLPNSGITEPLLFSLNPILQPPAHFRCTCFLLHNYGKFISGLHSLAIINHMLFIPPHLCCTCALPASLPAPFWAQ